jgi:hypothetical protein
VSVGAVGRAQRIAREGRLYPATILHGGNGEIRRAAALELARTLLCEREKAAERPCGACRHCRRIAWPGEEAPFHPDFAVLERDLKTSTSAEATRDFLRAAHASPFEARGQVFVVGAAETLSSEAGDALLKAIEEPGTRSPRHFFLLAPSRLDLPATLRSRSMALFLGPAEPPEAKVVEKLAVELAASLGRFAAERNPLFLLDAAGRLAAAGDFSDPRAEAGWLLAARVLTQAATAEGTAAGLRPRLLALAESMLEASPLRLRGIPAERILEGLVAKHLAGVAG